MLKQWLGGKGREVGPGGGGGASDQIFPDYMQKI